MKYKPGPNAIACDEVMGCVVSTTKLHPVYQQTGLGAFETNILGPDGEWGWKEFAKWTHNEADARAAHAEGIEFVKRNIQ